ncbi:hypothetical protein [Mycobacterium heckeshornense]|nr:hypothetical protein [Mycobacterium heckeshornense]
MTAATGWQVQSRHDGWAERLAAGLAAESGGQRDVATAGRI